MHILWVKCGSSTQLNMLPLVSGFRNPTSYKKHSKIGRLSKIGIILLLPYPILKPFIYTNMYIYIPICIYIYTPICIYIYTNMRKNIPICIYIYLHTHIVLPSHIPSSTSGYLRCSMIFSYFRCLAAAVKHLKLVDCVTSSTNRKQLTPSNRTAKIDNCEKKLKKVKKPEQL